MRTLIHTVSTAKDSFLLHTRGDTVEEEGTTDSKTLILCPQIGILKVKIITGIHTRNSSKSMPLLTAPTVVVLLGTRDTPLLTKHVLQVWFLFSTIFTGFKVSST
jgi:hypothetical protein